MLADGAGRVVLLEDYPLRLWERQTAHNEELLREFYLLMESEREGLGSAPADLVAIAQQLTEKFGALIETLNDQRRAALDAGHARMAFSIPLRPEALPYLQGVMDVLHRTDEYCAQARLLTLPRAPELVALPEWSISEFVGQHGGADPKPWPGPF